MLDNNISVTLYTQTGETDNELISKFKDEISDSEMIAFEFSNRKTVNLLTKHKIKPSDNPRALFYAYIELFTEISLE